MSFAAAFSYSMAIISVALQLALVTSDDLGGISGQDSIIQAFVSTFDVSTGLLFIFYHWNFIWAPNPGDRTALRRWRFLHSHIHYHSEQIKISLRLSLWDFNSKADRVGTLKYREQVNEATASSSGQCPTNPWQPIKFSNNFSVFLIPFMKHRNTQDIEVFFSYETVMKAAAQSVARLAIFLSLSFTFFFLRITIAILYSPSFRVRCVICITEFLRLFIAINHELSVVTYSLYYKGVWTWATFLYESDIPEAELCIDRKRKPWSLREEKVFEAAVWKELKWWNPARIIFWTACRGWPPVFKRWTRIFERWSIPDRREFSNEEGLYELRFEVCNPHGLQQPSPQRLYKVDFKNVPAQYLSLLGGYLGAVPEYRVFGILALLSSVLHLGLPFIFLAYHPNNLAKVCYVIEQAVAKLLRYYDPHDFSINTKLETVIVPEWNI